MSYKSKKQHEGKTVTLTCPSVCGSHSSMVKEMREDGTATLVDERGEYVTLIERIDNGLADPNRWDLVKRNCV
jgi:hypothetical protein